MKHISQSTVRVNGLIGNWIMPVTKHVTYCWQTVPEYEIDNEHPTCEECMDAKVWEQIDLRG